MFGFKKKKKKEVITKVNKKEKVINNVRISDGTIKIKEGYSPVYGEREIYISFNEKWYNIKGENYNIASLDDKDKNIIFVKVNGKYFEVKRKYSIYHELNHPINIIDNIRFYLNKESERLKKAANHTEE